MARPKLAGWRDGGKMVVGSGNSKPYFRLPIKGAFVWEYSGIRIYSGIYSGYSAPGSKIAGMEIQVFRNRNSSETNANLHYSNYSYSGLIPNECALSYVFLPPII